MGPRPHLDIDGLVKVLMLLDERLHAVQGVPSVFSVQEGLPGSHPVLGLLAVAVEELKGRARAMS